MMGQDLTAIALRTRPCDVGIHQSATWSSPRAGCAKGDIVRADWGWQGTSRLSPRHNLTKGRRMCRFETLIGPVSGHRDFTDDFGPAGVGSDQSKENTVAGLGRCRAPGSRRFEVGQIAKGRSSAAASSVRARRARTSATRGKESWARLPPSTTRAGRVFRAHGRACPAWHRRIFLTKHRRAGAPMGRAGTLMKHARHGGRMLPATSRNTTSRSPRPAVGVHGLMVVVKRLTPGGLNSSPFLRPRPAEADWAAGSPRGVGSRPIRHR